MKIDRYKLLDLDQMEASIVRRRLRRWNKADEEAIRPLIGSMQQASCLDGVDIVEPRYETSVYPLYYYWAHLHGVRHRDLGEHMFREFAAATSTSDKAQLLPQVLTLVSTEIDILSKTQNTSPSSRQRNQRPVVKRRFRSKVVYINLFGNTRKDVLWRD